MVATLLRAVPPLRAAAGLSRSAPVHAVVTDLPRLVEHASPLGFSLAYFVADLVGMPAAALAPAAGVLFGTLFGVLIVLSAGTASAAVAFSLGRHFRERGLEKLSSRPRLEKPFSFIDRVITRGGFKAMLLLRLIPTPLPAINYAYGFTAIPFKSFVFASALGYVPGTLMIVGGGAAGKQLLTLPVGGGARMLLLACVLAVAALLANNLVDVAKGALDHLAEDAPGDAEGAEADECRPWAPAAPECVA